MKNQTNDAPKKQDKSSATDHNEMELYCFSDREFKITGIKMFTKVKQTIHEQSDNFHKEVENIKKHQTEILELKNTITKMKN